MPETKKDEPRKASPEERAKVLREIVTALKESGVDDTQAQAVGNAVDVYQQSPPDPDLQALVIWAGRFGNAGAVTSHRFRNIVYNWKASAFGLPTAGAATAGAIYTGNPFALVGAVLAAISVLAGGMSVKLGSDHSHLVMALWGRDHDGQDEVPIAVARSALPSVSEAEFEGILADLEALGIVDVSDGERIVKKERILFTM
jgi:hypothetical protein